VGGLLKFYIEEELGTGNDCPLCVGLSLGWGVACSWELTRWGANCRLVGKEDGLGGGVLGLVEPGGGRVGQGQGRLQLGYLNLTRTLIAGGQPGLGFEQLEELAVMPSNLEGAFWAEEFGQGRGGGGWQSLLVSCGCRGHTVRVMVQEQRAGGPMVP